ncbi:MAG: hypothetical protein ACR2H0_06060 [Candidatus Limnocylindrales bacterium]
MAEVCRTYGTGPTPEQMAAFGGSVAEWPTFPDSAEALARLNLRFRLGVITNGDDDLFAFSNARLGQRFEWTITAQQAGSYKPSTHNLSSRSSELIGRETVSFTSPRASTTTMSRPGSSDSGPFG